MAFEKAFENTYNDLEQETKYRFAELELFNTIDRLTQFYRLADSPRLTAVKHLFNAITPPSQQTEERESRFHDALKSTYFNTPPKQEIIKYLIIHAQSYQKIRDLTKASFNTIANNRYGIPYYYPAFDMWTPEMLDNWNSLKNIFNIWNEKIIHTI